VSAVVTLSGGVTRSGIALVSLRVSTRASPPTETSRGASEFAEASPLSPLIEASNIGGKPLSPGGKRSM
jgi:hypothetical protein